MEDYKRCIQLGLKVGVNIKGVYVSVAGQGGSCDGLLNEMGGKVPCFIRHPAECPLISLFTIDAKTMSISFSPADTKHGSMVEDFVVVVRGGNSESISALLSRKLPTPQLMGLWGEGVRFNPDFIRRTVSHSFNHEFCLLFLIYLVFLSLF